MKIFVIPSWYPPAGGQFFVQQSRWLRDAGVDVTMIVIEEKSLKTLKSGNVFKDLIPTFSQEFGLPTFRKKQLRIPKSYRLNTKYWIRQMVKLTEMAIQQVGAPDLIQVHSCLFASAAAARIKEKYDIPYIITEHRGRFNESNLRPATNLHPWFYPYISEGLLKASHIIPVSRKLIPKLEEIAGKTLPCTVLPNPVDEKLFDLTTSKTGRKEQTHFISISAFMPVKALDILVKAFAEALKTTPSLVLHFVGDGEERKKIEALVKSLSLTDSVKFHGFLTGEGVKEMILQSDFLVLSSLTEAQPVSVAETLLCGKAVISTDVVSEEDVPEFAGYLVKTGDTRALAETMLRAHSEKKQFEPERIRKFALSRFAKSVVIPGIIEIMNNVRKQETPRN